MSSIRKYFKPELLNRIDEIILFESLSQNSLEEISALFLDRLVLKAKKIDITLEYSPNLPRYLSCNKETEKYGARPLKRSIKNNVENPLTEKILKKEIFYGDKVFVDICEEQIKLIRCTTEKTSSKHRPQLEVK